MYDRVDEITGEIKKEFKEGLTQFMQFASNQGIFREEGKMICPCHKCGNEKFITIERVWNNLFLKGFIPGYYIWLSHGEEFEELASTSDVHRGAAVDERGYEMVGQENNFMIREQDSVVQMVTDAFRETLETGNYSEEPNVEAKRFYNMLEASRIPIYSCCKEGQSLLSAATRLMSIKIQWNFREDCVNAIADFAKDYMPAVYAIWRERNKCRHEEPPTPPQQLARMIDKAIRNRLILLQTSEDKRYGDILIIWFDTCS